MGLTPGAGFYAESPLRSNVLVREYRDIEVSGDAVSRLETVIDSALASGMMKGVIRRAAIVEGHAVVEFTKDSTNGERCAAACRFFAVARGQGIETGSIEASDWLEWLDFLGMKEENGEARAK